MIDDALRRASLEQGVEVRIMASLWNRTKPDMIKYLHSLAALSGAMKATVSVVCHNPQAPVLIVVSTSNAFPS